MRAQRHTHRLVAMLAIRPVPITQHRMYLVQAARAVIIVAAHPTSSAIMVVHVSAAGAQTIAHASVNGAPFHPSPQCAGAAHHGRGARVGRVV
eukprot:1161547-Pelagomonas_calceolata.AAC.8